MLRNLFLLISHSTYLRVSVRLQIWPYCLVLWKMELTESTCQCGIYSMKSFQWPSPLPAPSLYSSSFRHDALLLWTMWLHRIHIQDVTDDMKEISGSENVLESPTQGESLWRRTWEVCRVQVEGLSVWADVAMPEWTRAVQWQVE